MPAVAPGPGGEGLELVVRPDPTIRDGRFAHLAWLQELPKPLTKLVWGNAVTIAPALAARESIAQGDVVAVAAGGRRVEGPAWILPGQADGTVGVSLGYGRRLPEQLPDGLGYDPAPLLGAAGPATWPGPGGATRRSPRPRTTARWRGTPSCGSRPPARASPRPRPRPRSTRRPRPRRRGGSATSAPGAW